jgi:putative acyl-CoA dehydrogenase
VAAKAAATLGMAMTEKQGGSDLRANSTRAQRDGAGYRLTGHKWFCSAPMCDGFLTLAQADGGLTCFLVPRWLPDGTRNAFTLMRLKDKLGNRANASSEVEFDAPLLIAWRGRARRGHDHRDGASYPSGLRDCARRPDARGPVRGAALGARAARLSAPLIDQPLMRAVLADLALEAEGALTLGMEVAAAFDDPARRPFARLSVALAKFLINKRAPGMIYECMEALGGMGYVEETPLPCSTARRRSIRSGRGLAM